MHLTDLFDIRELVYEIDAGYVRIGRHPALGLRTLCYTEKTVLDNRWNNITRRCRGLIVDPDDEIVAWCMPKFHNASEHIEGRAYAAPLPDEPFEVFAKIDGSMGTIFCYQGKWLAATKGGFGSDQAQWAQQWLDKHDLSELPQSNTYTVEIIYPKNRIVVDNGDFESLVLLTVFGSDGSEKPINGYGQAWERLGGQVIRQHPAAKLSRILFYAQRNQRIDGTAVTGAEAEGYVIRYSSGLRVKVKFSDYIRLHGIVTGLTERHIWELLRDGQSLESLFEVLPDEYHDWLTDTSQRLNALFAYQAKILVHSLRASNLPSDPRLFQQYAAEDGPNKFHGLFALYSLVAQQTWDSIKPAATGPWKDHE